MHIRRADLDFLLQDFKEAARLSAESKARAAEAEAASARATELRGRAAGLESDEAALAGDAARLQGELLAAKRVLALAKWRRLKVGARILPHYASAELHVPLTCSSQLMHASCTGHSTCLNSQKLRRRLQLSAQ